MDFPSLPLLLPVNWFSPVQVSHIMSCDNFLIDFSRVSLSKGFRCIFRIIWRLLKFDGQSRTKETFKDKQNRFQISLFNGESFEHCCLIEVFQLLSEWIFISTFCLSIKLKCLLRCGSVINLISVFSAGRQNLVTLNGTSRKALHRIEAITFSLKLNRPAFELHNKRVP